MQTSQFSVAIAASNTMAYSPAVLIGGQPVVALEVDNSANAAALSDFAVQAMDNDGGEWYDYITAAVFAAGIANNVLFVGASAPGTLAAGARTHAHLRTNGTRYLRFRGTLASGTGTITVRGSKIDL